MTKNIREAVQFPTRKEAAIAANVIGWRTCDVIEIDIMGFRLWSLGDDHGSYLTGAEFNLLATERVAALTPKVN